MGLGLPFLGCLSGCWAVCSFIQLLSPDFLHFLLRMPSRAKMRGILAGWARKCGISVTTSCLDTPVAKDTGVLNTLSLLLWVRHHDPGDFVAGMAAAGTCIVAQIFGTKMGVGRGLMDSAVLRVSRQISFGNSHRRIQVFLMPLCCAFTWLFA